MYLHLRKIASGTKSIAKVPNQNDKLVQNCVILSQRFLHKTAAFYTEQCTSPSLFHNFEVSQGGSNQSLKSYGFICKAIFFFT